MRHQLDVTTQDAPRLGDALAAAAAALWRALVARVALLGERRVADPRRFAAVLGDELERGVRFRRPLSLVLADVEVAWEARRAPGVERLATAVRADLRAYDVLARLGAARLAVVLPETEADDAARVAERMRAAIAGAGRVSLGVATFPEHGVDVRELLRSADAALRRARSTGTSVAVACAPTRRAHLVALPGGRARGESRSR